MKTVFLLTKTLQRNGKFAPKTSSSSESGDHYTGKTGDFSIGITGIPPEFCKVFHFQMQIKTVIWSFIHSRTEWENIYFHSKGKYVIFHTFLLKRSERSQIIFFRWKKQVMQNLLTVVASKFKIYYNHQNYG